MKIYNIDLTTSSLAMFQDKINKCQEIIIENLETNGGILRQSDIFAKDFDWTNLIIADIDGEIVGFALIRLSKNMHNLIETNNYYYLSDIVVKNAYKKMGIGTALIEASISCKKGIPLVASVLMENQASIALLSKFMTSYGVSKSGRYLRFVDNESYSKLYNNFVDDSIISIESFSPKIHK